MALESEAPDLRGSPPDRAISEWLLLTCQGVIGDAGRPQAKALITRANFSETVQRHNYEAGCLITEPWQVSRVSKHFQNLTQQRHVIQLEDK